MLIPDYDLKDFQKDNVIIIIIYLASVNAASALSVHATVPTSP